MSGKLTAEGAKAYRDNAHKGWTVLAEGLTEKQVEEAAQRTARGITVDVPTRIDTFGTDGRGRATGILAGAADELMGADGAVRTLGDSIDALAKGPIMALDDAMAGAFEAMISGSGRASEAFKSAIGGAIKAVAQAEGRLYAGKALGALGEGLFTGKPNAFLAAAKYGSAATAFFALAGAGGAFGSGGGGGGGSAGSGGPTQEGGSLRGAVGAGKITVVLNGSRTVIDHRNNDDLDALREMLGTLAGNREIELVYGGR